MQGPSAFWLIPILVLYWVYRTFLVPYPRFEVLEPLDLDNPEAPRVICSVSDAISSQHNRIEVINGGEHFYRAELEAIQKARRSINIEIYTFFPDGIGRQFIDMLTAAARRGVQVRLLIDGVGGQRLMYFHRRLLNQLRGAGGQVFFYHPLALDQLELFNTRTHREIYVMDGRVAFVGGAGIADHWAKATRGPAPWRDFMTRLEGPAVAGIQGVFLENWAEVSDEILVSHELFPPLDEPGDMACLVINSSARSRSSPTRILHQVLLASAKETILIGNPYFLPDPMIRREIATAARRGVDVKIITTGKKTDHAITRAGSRRLYRSLLEAGVEIFEYSRTMYHAKVFLVDGKWAVVGTSNMDNRSFGINDEILLAIPEPSIIKQLSDDFMTDLEVSEQVTLAEWRRRSFFERVHAQLSRLIERQQ